MDHGEWVGQRFAKRHHGNDDYRGVRVFIQLLQDNCCRMSRSVTVGEVPTPKPVVGIPSASVPHARYSNEVDSAKCFGRFTKQTIHEIPDCFPYCIIQTEHQIVDECFAGQFSPDSSLLL